MAIISNFELLIKPIAPPDGPGAEVARVVIQGYFLEVSNLEPRDLKLIFRTRTSTRDSTDSPNTEFTATNNNLVYDITQDNDFESTMVAVGDLIANRQRGHYISCLLLPAGQTASIGLLPDVAGVLPFGADLAIRGYTELLLSSNIDNISPLNFSSPTSARVLVSPEHRSTFLDPQFNPVDPATQTGLDFDQTAYSIPTANGQGIQTLNTHARFNNPFQDFLTSDFGSTELGSSGSSIASLADLSANLAPDASAPSRVGKFMLGTVPIRIDYSIQNGKYVVGAESVSKALNLVARRRKVSKGALPNNKNLVSRINAALSGDKDADTEVQRILNDLIQ